MSEVGRDTMKHGVGNTAITPGGSARGGAVAEVSSRANGESPIFGGAVGMLKHGSGGVREGSPLSFRFGELVVGVRGRELGSVARRGDHGAASNNIKVVRITVELDGGPESSTSREQARVQVPDFCENEGHSGTNCFLGSKCKEVFGSPRPSLLEWAEDVRAECMTTCCRLSAGLVVDRGMVRFG
jgi:hypothetical protein